MTRDEIVDEIAARLGIDADDDEALEEAGIILFDGMEPAFIGLAERFEPVTEVRVGPNDEILGERETGGTHRYFAVYSYRKMVEILVADGDMDDTDAMEYLEFNTVGLYAGPSTPAILRDME